MIMTLLPDLRIPAHILSSFCCRLSTSTFIFLERIKNPEDGLCREVDAMIIVRITMHVLPEKHKEIVQTLLSLMHPMEREAGCLSYAILCDVNDKNMICVLEEWESRKMLDQHLKSDLFGVLLGSKSLLCHSHGVHIYTVQQEEGIKAVLAVRNKRQEVNYD